jgi:pimeloyl-ACP methyl ester carboxylesterase
MDRLLADLVIWYGTHRRGTNSHRTPATVGLEYQNVSFPSAGSNRAQLSGWLVSSAEPKGVVLLCHGIDSAAYSMLPKAELLVRHGFACLLFDFRATGRSGGTYVTLGHHEADDVLGAVEFVESLAPLRHLPILAIGQSMGGAAVIRAAARSDQIRAIVSEATFATLADALNRRLKLLGPFARRVSEHCHRIGAEKYQVDIANVSPERDIVKLGPRPLLLIHDNLDVLCPRAESDRLFAAASAPKERWDVPYAPHTFAQMVAPREYERRVVDFLSRAVAAEPARRLNAALPHSPAA